jgi:hypothetical protein
MQAKNDACPQRFRNIADEFWSKAPQMVGIGGDTTHMHGQIEPNTKRYFHLC